jgi:hypothetical protein
MNYQQLPERLMAAKEYHEDFGDCLFFHFGNFDEPPDVCCGSPLNDYWDNEYWSHFIRFDFNQVMDQAKNMT